MRRIEKMLYSGAGYTILIMTFFYIFAIAAELEGTSIGIGKFFLILAFGMIAAGAELVYELLSVKRIIRSVIHYAILLVAFCVIFIAGDFFNITGPASVFVAITLFTVIYLVFVGIVCLIRRSVQRADNALEGKIKKRANNGKTMKKAERDKEEYTPRFK